MKYRKKPVVIEAKQLTDNSFQEIYNWISESGYVKEWCWDSDDTMMPPIERFMKIKTFEGFITASEFDWVIKGVKGEFYPCKPDIFEMTYEPAGENNDNT